MITLRLRLPCSEGVETTVLELPEREGRPDALDVLDAAIARIDGGPEAGWRTALATPGRSGGIEPPTEPPARLPGPASAALAVSGGSRDPPVSGVRETSRDALHRLQASGELGRQEMAVYRFVREAGGDVTRQEIAEGLGLGINAVTGRIFTLIHDHGLLKETQRRACRVTGESVMAIGTVETQ